MDRLRVRFRVGPAGVSSARRVTAPWTFPSHARHVPRPLAARAEGRSGEPSSPRLPLARPDRRALPALAEFLAVRGTPRGSWATTTSCNSCTAWHGASRYEDYYDQNVTVSPWRGGRLLRLGRKLVDLACGSRCYHDPSGRPPRRTPRGLTPGVHVVRIGGRRNPGRGRSSVRIRRDAPRTTHSGPRRSHTHLA